MSVRDLIKKYELVPVARVSRVGNELKIQITDQETANLEKCIYAFLIGGKVRVGSSKAKLASRLKSYERDFTNAFKHKNSSTSEQEAKQWKKLLPVGKSGEIFARRGREVSTPLGKFPAYLDEESLLIGEMFKRWPKRVLNRNKHR